MITDGARIHVRSPLLVIRTLMLVAAVIGLGSEAQTATRAARTADFLNILGINGHIDSNISQYLNVPGVLADSQYIGIRHWREGLGAQKAWQTAPLRALVNAGISLVALPLQKQSITVSDTIARAKLWAAWRPDALYALEGPNEPFNFPITYAGVSTGPASKPTTYLPVAKFQRDYYAAVKADPVLHALPVWSVSSGGTEPDNVGLQYLTIPSPLPPGVLMPSGTVYADTANIHLYPMYEHGAQTIDHRADRIKINYYAHFVRTYTQHYPGYTEVEADALPRVITEFGYPAKGGVPGGITVDIPTQGKNILTGLFNAWMERYGFVAIYDLYDLGDGYGIFYGTGKPKPSATYLHNLTSVLADLGQDAHDFPTGSLEYTLKGLPSMANTSLFQKSSGVFELVMWNNVANWDISTGAAIPIASTNVNLSLSSNARVIRVFNPVTGMSPVQSVAATNAITIPLSDSPVVIEIDSAAPETGNSAPR